MLLLCVVYLRESGTLMLHDEYKISFGILYLFDVRILRAYSTYPHYTFFQVKIL